MAKKKAKSKARKKKSAGAKDVQLRAALSYLEQWSKDAGAVIVDLHSHTSFSDGMLTPQELVERASKRGVRVLAITDHDTMAGVPAAIVAARRYGIRIIPGVEVSARYVKSSGEMGETVHILAYYGCCGPAQGLEEKLTAIREGRFDRARSMVRKLQDLKKPVTWESVVRIAGAGVAPGRPHVARALVQAGFVGSVREAFDRYLCDGGPAYATGRELPADEAVKLILDTGGVAALAHPWTLKNPLDVIKQLKGVGLHAMEVYRFNGRDKGFAALADEYDLIKLGGSDFHGTGAPDETDLGKVEVPAKALHELLRVAHPIWSASLKQILSSFAQGSLERPFKGNDSTPEFLCGDVELLCEREQVKSIRLSSWLSEEERDCVSEVAVSYELQCSVEERGNLVVCKKVL